MIALLCPLVPPQNDSASYDFVSHAEIQPMSLTLIRF